jgi:hypothetical protein
MPRTARGVKDRSAAILSCEGQACPLSPCRQTRYEKTRYSTAVNCRLRSASTHAGRSVIVRPPLWPARMPLSIDNPPPPSPADSRRTTGRDRPVGSAVGRARPRPTPGMSISRLRKVPPLPARQSGSARLELQQGVSSLRPPAWILSAGFPSESRDLFRQRRRPLWFPVRNCRS